LRVRKLAGLCLIILGVINVLHEIVLRSRGASQPGMGYAIVTAAFIATGTALICLKRVTQRD